MTQSKSQMPLDERGLPPHEAARCAHRSRRLAASGAYSRCTECGIEAVLRAYAGHQQTPGES